MGSVKNSHYLGEWARLTLQESAGIHQWVDIFDGACVEWRLEQAKYLLRQAKQTAPSVEARAKIYHGEGMLYIQLNDWDRAMDSIVKGMNLLEGTHHSNDYILMVNDLGMVCRMQGYLEEACSAHEYALELAQRIEQPYLIAESLEHIGLDLMLDKKPEQALSYFRQALAHWREQEYMVGMISALHSLGEGYQKIGDLLMARQMLKESLSVIETHDNNAYLAAQVTASLANIDIEEGHLDNAETNWLSALSTFDKVGGLFDKIGILNNLGTLAYHKRDYETAQEYYEQSMDLAGELGNDLGVEDALGNFVQASKALENKTESTK